MKMPIIKSGFLLLFLFSSNVSFSQTEKGKYLIAGQYVLNFSSNASSFVGQSNSYEYGRYRNLALSPQAGYFIFDHVPIGLEFLYTYARTSGGSSTYHSSTYTFIPFIRYYFGKSAIKPYIQAGAGPGWGKGASMDFGYASTSKTKLFRYELTGGLGAFINKYISIDLSLSYKATSETYASYTTVGNPETKIFTKNLEALVGFVICL
jgi:hypothetical protein